MNDAVFDLKRRRVIQAIGLGSALVSAPSFPIILKKEAFKREGRQATAAFAPDVDIELTASVARVPILQGRQTQVWRYQGKVLKGDPASVVTLPDNYLGPILRFKTGQRVRVRMKNRLPQNHIVHWHGMHVPFEADGHPSYEASPGETYVYEFEVKNRASTNWFHPHTHHATAAQAYAGLAGLVIVEDEEERALPLPRGEFDLPLILQDRTFTSDNQLLYDHRGPLSVLGFLGERIVVNGKPDLTLEVADRSYRFRILNGSNARIFKLAWSDGEPVTVIGTDGGLLERPVIRPYLMISPGERYEIWRDFRGARGREVVLESREFKGTMPPPYEKAVGGGSMRDMMRQMMSGGRGMMGGARHGMGPMAILARHLPQGSRMELVRFRVNKKSRENQPLPDRLRSIPRYRLEETVNSSEPRPIAVGNQGHRFTLNGHLFEMTGASKIETFPVNTLHLLEIFHAHGEMKMKDGHSGEDGSGMAGMGSMNLAMRLAMAHPIHLHGAYFQIVERMAPHGDDEHGAEGYETVKDGFVDDGYQETVLVMPGERLRLIKPFPDYKGLFLYHCHNLEHENAGMMRNFKVV